MPPEMSCKRASTTAMLPAGYGILTESVHGGSVVWRTLQKGAATRCLRMQLPNRGDPTLAPRLTGWQCSSYRYPAVATRVWILAQVENAK